VNKNTCLFAISKLGAFEWSGSCSESFFLREAQRTSQVGEWVGLDTSLDSQLKQNFKTM